MGVLVTGAKGQLGFEVCRRLESLGITNRGAGSKELDLRSREGTLAYIRAYNPEAVINCGAYTAVDKAEAEMEQCYNVNVSGTRYLAEACKEVGAKLLHVSTEYVFDGSSEGAYETDTEKKPVNYYGETKSAGEDEVTRLLDQYFIVRVSWVFGINGHNFVKTMLRLGQENESVSVVTDQIGSPTYAADLAVLLCDMIQTDRYGMYHATNEGECSWHTFASEIMKAAGLPCRVDPILTKDYITAAKRPLNSRLSKKSLDAGSFAHLPYWEDALARFIAELRMETVNG